MHVREHALFSARCWCLCDAMHSIRFITSSSALPTRAAPSSPPPPSPPLLYLSANTLHSSRPYRLTTRPTLGDSAAMERHRLELLDFPGRFADHCPRSLPELAAPCTAADGEKRAKCFSLPPFSSLIMQQDGDGDDSGGNLVGEAYAAYGFDAGARGADTAARFNRAADHAYSARTHPLSLARSADSDCAPSPGHARGRPSIGSGHATIVERLQLRSMLWRVGTVLAGACRPADRLQGLSSKRDWSAQSAAAAHASSSLLPGADAAVGRFT
ncbi:hypothetical protein SYNPS1DRAFT_31819 [Syncephalis pseudoplumigaleata]|uniref:Uncharacterized protein n=1 Tax=Syncephalis pseudoplumigaleata TaxID=1712513 RepID=A0A4P9YT39_9FUNG|nr:hypothetical protein SYNPS1DRAFT_31819 [Syncephalis pseudoplumigaleata]|eukprot:RKP22572.1 hypothetical protein SYNPS1DRAFT_31819 [Syncephalis pseudoplumigaleata]